MRHVAAPPGGILDPLRGRPTALPSPPPEIGGLAPTPNPVTSPGSTEKIEVGGYGTVNGQLMQDRDSVLHNFSGVAKRNG